MANLIEDRDRACGAEASDDRRLRTERAQDHLRQAKVTKPAVDAIEAPTAAAGRPLRQRPPKRDEDAGEQPGRFPPVNNGDPKTGDLSTTIPVSRVCVNARSAGGPR